MTSPFTLAPSGRGQDEGLENPQVAFLAVLSPNPLKWTSVTASEYLMDRVFA